MAKLKKFLGIWIFCFSLSHFAKAQIFLNGFGGGSLHWPGTLNLQLGKYHYTIEEVHFSSRSLEFPLYYGFSLGKEISASRFSIEFIHDKAFVPPHRFVRVRKSNNSQMPSGTCFPFEAFLSRFSISHGCNVLVLKYAHRFFAWRKGFGGYGGIATGVLIPHVESQHFQGKKSQYEIHFPAGMIDWIFQWKMAKALSLVGGWKVTTARIVHAHVVGGNVSFWIWALHGILGVEIYP